jgi:hypothetical protein
MMTENCARFALTALLLAWTLAACGGDDDAGGAAGATGGGSLSDHAVPETSSGGNAGTGGGATGGSTGDAAPDTSADFDVNTDDGPLNCPSLEAGSTADVVTVSDEGSVTVTPPANLVDTGLYCDIGAHILAPGVRYYRPRFELWSDGAEKTRWVSLPAGQQINTTDPDHWSFPVGTKFWKEFKYLGKRVETRIIARFGAGEADWYFAAYQWNAAETEATLAPYSGVVDAAPIVAGAEPPMHDIPGVPDCQNCHTKLPERILSFGAIQLSHSLGGETIATLVQQDLLSAPPSDHNGYTVPGDDVDQTALGYLHANCGNCHNATGVVRPTPFRLRLLVGTNSSGAIGAGATVESTDAYQTAVDVPHGWAGAPADAGLVYRIQSGHAETSEIMARTGMRGLGQMPPIATKIVDTSGRAHLAAWINRLVPREAGASDDAGTDASTGTP